jgi:hypothetical protein
MITSDWNYDLQELNDFIQQLIQAAIQIQSFEEQISKVPPPPPPALTLTMGLESTFG